jgi:hypothetical protein
MAAILYRLQWGDATQTKTKKPAAKKSIAIARTPVAKSLVGKRERRQNRKGGGHFLLFDTLFLRAQMRGGVLALVAGLAAAAAAPAAPPPHSAAAVPEIVEYPGNTACPELPRQGAGVSTDRVKFLGTAANISACAEAAASWTNSSAPPLWQR